MKKMFLTRKSFSELIAFGFIVHMALAIFSVFMLSFLTPLKKQNWCTLGIYEEYEQHTPMFFPYMIRGNIVDKVPS